MTYNIFLFYFIFHHFWSAHLVMGTLISLHEFLQHYQCHHESKCFNEGWQCTRQLNTAWSILVDRLLPALSQWDREVRGLCRKGCRQGRHVYALPMSRDGQTSQEISLSKDCLSDKEVHFYEQPSRTDLGQSGTCHRPWAPCELPQTTGQEAFLLLAWTSRTSPLCNTSPKHAECRLPMTRILFAL